MKKDNIISALQSRANEQAVLAHVPFAKLFLFLSASLGENPWRFFIPGAILLTLFFQVILGKQFDEIILALFGHL